jgi:Flp pilus assembly protein TadD
MTGHDAARTAWSEGRFADAAALCQEALQRNETDAEAWRLLGLSQASQSRYAEAVESYDRAVALKPDFFEAWFNRANALRTSGKIVEAVLAYDQALALRPTHAGSWNNRGIALLDQDRFAEALESFEHALASQPEHAGALNNQGNALQQLHRFDEALECYRRLLKIQPDHPDGGPHQAFLELLCGRLDPGWELFETRRRRASWVDPKFPGPELTSLEEAVGKSILVYQEQGLGDTIQFCRYAQLLAEHAKEVFLLPQARLPRLLRGLKGVRILGDGELTSATCDRHIPLLSLPRIFGTRMNSIPAAVPYLSAEPDRVGHWRERIGSQGFRIGITWQGNPANGYDRRRSFPLAALAPLRQVPGVRLISIQKLDGTEQLAREGGALGVESLGNEFDSGPHAFLDTAAVMESCDLVIASDTAIAHLAGALGRPVWVALPYVPDWRWFLKREDSPWYPTARLWRQDRPSHWAGVFERMAAALASRVTG